MGDVREKTNGPNGRTQPFDRFKWMRGWMRDERIDSSVTVAVLAALFDHMGQDGRCWPSVATLAGLAHCSERSVTKHLGIAKELGWVFITSRTNDSNIYQAATPEPAAPLNDVHPCTKCTPPLQDVHPTPEPAAPKQTIEQTNEQQQQRGREEDPEVDDCTWAADYQLESLPKTKRPQPKGVADYWRERTGETIRFMEPTGRGKHLRDICRYFDRETVKTHIDKATGPKIARPWAFFVGCLERVASGEGAPTSESRKRDSIEDAADRGLAMFDKLAGEQGGAQ